VGIERAELAAEKALHLDPELAEAHYAAGFLLWGVMPSRFVHERAVGELKRAISLNPNLADAHHYLGTVYLHIGLLDRAVAAFQRTLELEPTNHNALRRIGLALVYRGQYEEGLRTIREVPPESNSSLWHYQIAWALLYLGRNEDALTVIEEYLQAYPEDSGGVVTSTRAIWFAKAGNARQAEADIHSAIEKGKGFIHFHHSAYNIASAYALLGRAASAVQWLRTAAEGGWPCYPYFANDPNLATLHGNPGYEAFMRELKVQWDRFRLTL
jgi:tetratricopeptide (TPR) repeat protein